MKAKELIEQLSKLVEEHGDLDVVAHSNYGPGNDDVYEASFDPGWKREFYEVPPFFKLDC